LTRVESPAVVEVYLGAGVDVAAIEARETDYEVSVLRCPAALRDEGACRALLAAGAKVTATTDTFLLHFAESPGVVTALLEAGADPLAINRNGESTLFSPAATQHVETARELVALGVDVNVVNGYGETALCCARSFEVVEVLLAAGADVKLGTARSFPPLGSPAATIDARACRALITAGANVNGRDACVSGSILHRGGSYHPLRSARSVEVVEALLQAGSSVSVAEAMGVRPADPNHVVSDAAVCQALIAAGASVTADDDHRLVPNLGEARCDRMVHVLVAAGADVNAHDCGLGRTALHYAHSADVAKALLSYGASVNAVDDFNQTPLHTTSDPGVAQVLADAGGVEEMS